MQFSNVLSIFYLEHFFNYKASMTIKKLTGRSRFFERENFVHALSSQGFIWDNMVLNNLYLDLGINFASPQRGLTGLWSTGEGKDFQPILEWLFDDTSFHKSMCRHDPSCGHLGIGGFKYGNRKSGLIRASAYSHCKQPFYSRSTYGERHGKDFNADEVFKVSPGFIKHVSKMKHCLSLMKYRAYGVRLEVRFTASHWDVLYDRTMDLAKYHLQVHINWYKSESLWCFVEKRLDSLVALAKNFHSQRDSRYTARQLTGVAFIAYMLSSLVHRPSDRSWWQPFMELLKAHRCRKSMALFTPDLFKLSEDGSRWLCTVSLKQYLHGVFHHEIINKIEPDYDCNVKLPEWHYRLPTLLERNNINTNLNLDLGIYAEYIDLTNKENYYWDHAISYMTHYGFSNDCVEPFVNLIMHEVLFKFSKWDKYCKDKQSYEKLMAYGSNFFVTKIT
ncbi:hypothetical protein G6F37_007299 [Rhizopus arrhizus]|nr:hypothetical protein G6F38_010240 [Rhizopus arrhizus]KAG1156774.1 hypothetical protein G6F37_007299 [Rhizopus arrhizus]